MPDWSNQSNSKHLRRHVYFHKTFLEEIVGNMVFDQFAQKATIPRGSAGFPRNFQSSLSDVTQILKSVEFTGYVPLEMWTDADNIVGIDPGNYPFTTLGTEFRGKTIASQITRRVNADVEMYAHQYTTGNVARDFSLDGGLDNSVRNIGDMYGRGYDWRMQKYLLNNAVKNGLGAPLFSSSYQDIALLFANGKTSLAAAGGAGTPTSPTNNVVAAPQNLMGGGQRSGFVMPDWWTLDDIRTLKHLLDGERARGFGTNFYGLITPPPVHERLLADSDFIQGASLEAMPEMQKSFMMKAHGFTIHLTTEPGWVVGVDDAANKTEGVDTPTTTDPGTGTIDGNIDVGTIIQPRKYVSDLKGSGTQTYWQTDTITTTASTNSTGPLLPVYAFGADAYGALIPEGWNTRINVEEGSSKFDVNNLFTMIGASMLLALAVLQARHMKIMLGAVDGRTLSTFRNASLT